MPRPVCLVCGNAGVVIEHRISWKEYREGVGMVPRSAWADSEAKARSLMAELPGAAEDAEILSGARECPACKGKPLPAPSRGPSVPPEAEMWWMRERER